MRKTGKEILEQNVTDDDRHAWLSTASASELSDFLRWVKADNSWALHGRDYLNVVLARENIKLQKTIRNLTIWIFVLTLVMVILGILQFYPNLKNFYASSDISLTILIALILEICGVGILITDELGPFAATIRQDYEKVKAKAKWWQKPLFYLARKFGSSDPMDRESYIGESYPVRFIGFFLIFIGFLIQAIVLVIQINAS